MTAPGRVVRDGQTQLEFVRRVDGGHGAFGEVWLARDDDLERDVAVKILRRDLKLTDSGRYVDLRERLDKEARVMAKFRHPNIVEIMQRVDLGPDGIGLVMEYVPYGTLRAFIEAHPKSATPAQIAEIAEGVARGLDAIWREQQIVHRDIKPGNVFWEPGRTPKIADFGVAQILADSTRTANTRRPHPGTPAYMSPEQDAQVAFLDARSDQFSLAQTLYELLANHPHRVGLSPMAEERPDLPLAFVSALMRALEPNRDNRYATTLEFAEALAAAAGRSSVADGKVTAVPTRSPQTGRTLPIVLTFGLASVVVAASVVFANSQGLQFSQDQRTPLPTASPSAATSAAHTSPATSTSVAPTTVGPAASTATDAPTRVPPTSAPTLQPLPAPPGVAVATGVYVNLASINTPFSERVRFDFGIVNNSGADFIVRYDSCQLVITDDAGRRYPICQTSSTSPQQWSLSAGETKTWSEYYFGTLAPAARTLTVQFGTFSGASGPKFSWKL